jgi:NAD-dependent SIR2 family protein deacetylase
MKTTTTQAVASTVVAEGLADLQEREASLKALKKQLKEQAELQAWETKTKARNASYIVGSLRSPTAADVEVLGHCHGKVCDIKCSECSTKRVVNKQDAFQVSTCKTCRKAVKKQELKEKRVTKRLAGRSVEDIEREIKELESQLNMKQTG